MGEIASEHYAELMWSDGNPFLMDTEPWCDHPAWGGWKAYIERHANDTPEQRLDAEHELRHSLRSGDSLRCNSCEEQIVFLGGKAFTYSGMYRHQCIKDGTATKPTFKCKFCGEKILFRNKRPFNGNRTPHNCISANATAAPTTGE